MHKRILNNIQPADILLDVKAVGKAHRLLLHGQRVLSVQVDTG